MAMRIPSSYCHVTHPANVCNKDIKIPKRHSKRHPETCEHPMFPVSMETPPWCPDTLDLPPAVSDEWTVSSTIISTVNQPSEVRGKFLALWVDNGWWWLLQLMMAIRLAILIQYQATIVWTLAGSFPSLWKLQPSPFWINQLNQCRFSTQPGYQRVSIMIARWPGKKKISVVNRSLLVH